MQFFNILVIIMIIIVGKSQLFHQKLKTCLPVTDRANLTRNIFEGNSAIIIESTRRSSHKIVSQIIGILLKERLGYNVSIKEADWDSTTSTVNRIACNKRTCEGGKHQSHINMEVWMAPGFTSSEWVNRDLIIDCGPLGPSAKTGMFYYNNDNADLFDDWRKIGKSIHQNEFISQNKVPFKHYPIYGSCNDTSSSVCRTIFAIDPVLPSRQARLLNSFYKNWTIQKTESDLLIRFYFTWYPNEITVQYKLSRVLFPDCNHSFSYPPGVHCEDSVNQLAKVISIEIKSKAPLIYNLIDSFQLTQEDLLKFLRQVNISSSDREQQYYDIACDWIRNNKALWEPITVGWNTTKQLSIIMLLSKSEHNISDQEVTALEYALKHLNSNVSYFSTFQYQLQVKYTYITCDGQDMFQEYLQAVNIGGSDEDNPVIGILSGLSTNCMYSIYKVVNAQKKIMVSFRHEIYPILARHTNNHHFYTPYIFQTMPSKETYYALLVKISTHNGWNNYIIITDSDDYKSGLNISFIHKERIYQNSEVDDNDFEEFLEQSVKKFNAKIFMLDYTGDDIYKILCIAGKLRMTLDKGFVWIIYQRLSDERIKSKCYPYIKLITNNYFQLSPYENLDISCSDFYSNNLYRAINFIGRTVELAFHKDPGLNDFNADILMNYSYKVNSGEFFCLNQLKSHQSIKMDQNSLFWDTWFFYNLNGTEQISILEFKITEKFEFFDSLQVQIRSITHWEFPRDGKPKEQCWLSSLSDLLKIKCIHAQILFLVLISVGLLLILTVSFGITYYRKAKNTYNPMKRAFHDLVQDLLDIDIHSSKLILNHIIGRGAFGMVYGGEACNSKGILEAVAVKTISENSDWVEKTDFFTEAKVMRKLRHSNIVKLIGVCLENENNLIFIIMELMVEGDLRNYLLSRRSNATMYPENSVESIELINRINSFAKDAAEGLNYMHSQFMVHRDVACRNCLISHDFRIKLGDFGLTRYLSPPNVSGIYKSQGNLSLPVRWMPPEAIQYGFFSLKSDIWSFGILLFEIVTFGVCPYQDFSSSRNLDLMDKIKRNQISIIDYLPKSALDSTVHRLLEHCCAYDPKGRPESMEQIIAVLKSDNMCIRPYLTEDPPKFEGDNNLNNISMDSPGIVIGEEELPFTSPGEMQLNSSQKCINMINRAFGIKSISVKEKTDLPLVNLRPCQSSIHIAKNQLSAEGIDSICMKKNHLFVGSIPSDLGNDIDFHKKSRTSTRSINNILKTSLRSSNPKWKLHGKEFS